jgi:hypothetical protein
MEEGSHDLDHLVVGQLGCKLTHGGGFFAHKLECLKWWIT